MIDTADTLPAALAPGAEICGHRIEAVLGGGGFGTVYVATDLALERPVALKVLRPEAGAHLERFRDEARLLARINDPHVVQIPPAPGRPRGAPGVAPRLARRAHGHPRRTRCPRARPGGVPLLSVVAPSPRPWRFPSLLAAAAPLGAAAWIWFTPQAPTELTASPAAAPDAAGSAAPQAVDMAGPDAARPGEDAAVDARVAAPVDAAPPRRAQPAWRRSRAPLSGRAHEPPFVLDRGRAPGIIATSPSGGSPGPR